MIIGNDVNLAALAHEQALASTVTTLRRPPVRQSTMVRSDVPPPPGDTAAGTRAGDGS